MLYITLGETNDMVRGTSVYFDYNYEEEWLDDELVKEMIRDVDNSEVVSQECIKSPVLGQIPPTKLSGGVKTLILMLKEPELVTYASNCGDNCSKWILEIGRRQDIHIALGYIIDFGKPDDAMEAIITNNGLEVHKVSDYELTAIQLL